MESLNAESDEDLKDEFVRVQKAYEQRLAELQESMSALERAHIEWMSLDEGAKLIRLKVAAKLRKNGEVETVYSEKVRFLARQLIADLDKKADAARKRLAGRFRNAGGLPGGE
jgi:hypothetical protein